MFCIVNEDGDRKGYYDTRHDAWEALQNEGPEWISVEEREKVKVGEVGVCYL